MTIEQLKAKHYSSLPELSKLASQTLGLPMSKDEIRYELQLAFSVIDDEKHLEWYPKKNVDSFLRALKAEKKYVPKDFDPANHATAAYLKSENYFSRPMIHQAVLRNLGHDFSDEKIDEILMGTTVMCDQIGRQWQPEEDVFGLIVELRGGFYPFD